MNSVHDARIMNHTRPSGYDPPACRTQPLAQHAAVAAEGLAASHARLDEIEAFLFGPVPRGGEQGSPPMKEPEGLAPAVGLMAESADRLSKRLAGILDRLK